MKMLTPSIEQSQRVHSTAALDCHLLIHFQRIAQNQVTFLNLSLNDLALDLRGKCSFAPLVKPFWEFIISNGHYHLHLKFFFIDASIINTVKFVHCTQIQSQVRFPITKLRVTSMLRFGNYFLCLNKLLLLKEPS